MWGDISEQHESIWGSHRISVAIWGLHLFLGFLRERGPRKGGNWEPYIFLGPLWILWKHRKEGRLENPPAKRHGPSEKNLSPPCRTCHQYWECESFRFLFGNNHFKYAPSLSGFWSILPKYASVHLPLQAGEGEIAKQEEAKGLVFDPHDLMNEHALNDHKCTNVTHLFVDIPNIPQQDSWNTISWYPHPPAKMSQLLSATHMHNQTHGDTVWYILAIVIQCFFWREGWLTGHLNMGSQQL